MKIKQLAWHENKKGIVSTNTSFSFIIIKSIWENEFILKYNGGFIERNKSIRHLKRIADIKYKRLINKCLEQPNEKDI